MIFKFRLMKLELQQFQLLQQINLVLKILLKTKTNIT